MLFLLNKLNWMDQIKDKELIYKPYLRWAGGKRWLIKHIDKLLPIEFNNYHEPFLGGASIFIHLKSNSKIQGESFLSDFNEELITTYKQIQINVNEIIDKLSHYKNEVDFYYQLRSQQPSNETELAARFIYLNKTSYNGIYRVNRKGEYNVPFGYRTNDNPFGFDNLKNLNQLFQSDVSFNSGDFDIIRNNLNEHDLVFLDPPYTVAHENNGFVQYNQSIFSWQDQERLANLLQFINDSGAYFIMTNAAHVSIHELFGAHGDRVILSRHSTIGGTGATRQNVNEYIYTNINRRR